MIEMLPVTSVAAVQWLRVCCCCKVAVSSLSCQGTRTTHQVQLLAACSTTCAAPHACTVKCIEMHTHAKGTTSWEQSVLHSQAPRTSACIGLICTLLLQNSFLPLVHRLSGYRLTEGTRAVSHQQCQAALQAGTPQKLGRLTAPLRTADDDQTLSI